MRIVGKLSGVLVTAALGFGLATPAQAQSPQTETVNCTAGGKIQQALDRRLITRSLLLTFRGVCMENILIKSDDVTIRGQSAADTIQPESAEAPTIRIDGGRRVALDKLTILGGEGAVVGTRGASFDVTRATIRGGTRFGVVASLGAVGTLHNSTVSEVAGQGVVAASGGVMAVTASRITNNTGTGILGVWNSTVRVGQGQAGDQQALPVTVKNNGDAGVSVTDSSSLIVVGSDIDDNATTGIGVSRASSARIGIGSGGLVGANRIRRNGGSGVSVFQASQALVQGATIADSGGNGVTVTGGNASIFGSVIRRSAGRGILVTEGGSAKIGLTDGNAVNGNTIEDSGNDGVGVFQGGVGLLGGNTIRRNARLGVNVGRAVGRLVGANVIEGNGLSGLGVFDGAQVFQGRGEFTPPTDLDIIRDNAEHGVNMFQGASATLQKVAVTGNTQRGVSASLKSSLRLQDSVVSTNGTDGVGIFNGSSVELRGTTVSDNGAAGVNMFNGAVADIRTTTVSGSGGRGLSVSLRSSLFMADASVTANTGDGIGLFTGSALQVNTAAFTVRENLGVGINCFGSETSVTPLPIAGVSDNELGDIGEDCTGF